MKNKSYYSAYLLCLILSPYFSSFHVHGSPSSQLDAAYQSHCSNPSDINEHLPVLRKYASECLSAAEIGVKPVVSTWGVLQGLSENPWPGKNYIGIDAEYPPLEKLQEAQEAAQDNDIQFTFLHRNDMGIDLEPVDMLFIDSLHTYCHLTYELETFSPKVRKYICLHDTSEPFGNQDDPSYKGDYSEYPASYDRTKKGLWPAVEDFLKRHPEWSLLERRTNNHGLTILHRSDDGNAQDNYENSASR